MALTQRDRDRLKELHAVVRGQLRTGQVAQKLGLSSRQMEQWAPHRPRHELTLTLDGGVQIRLDRRRPASTCRYRPMVKCMPVSMPPIRSKRKAAQYAIGLRLNTCGMVVFQRSWNTATTKSTATTIATTNRAAFPMPPSCQLRFAPSTHPTLRCQDAARRHSSVARAVPTRATTGKPAIRVIA